MNKIKIVERKLLLNSNNWFYLILNRLENRNCNKYIDRLIELNQMIYMVKMKIKLLLLN